MKMKKKKEEEEEEKEKEKKKLSVNIYQHVLHARQSATSSTPSYLILIPTLKR